MSGNELGEMIRLTRDEKGIIYKLAVKQIDENREKDISDWDEESQALFILKRKMGGL